MFGLGSDFLVVFKVGIRWFGFMVAHWVGGCLGGGWCILWFGSGFLVFLMNLSKVAWFLVWLVVVFIALVCFFWFIGG